MIAVARHLVPPEVRIGEADVRPRNARVEIDRALEVLDRDGDLGRIQRLELQPPFHERAIRIQCEGAEPVQHGDDSKRPTRRVAIHLIRSSSSDRGSFLFRLWALEQTPGSNAKAAKHAKKNRTSQSEAFPATSRIEVYPASWM